MLESLNSWATSIAGQMLLLADGAAPAPGAPGEGEAAKMPWYIQYAPMIMIAVLGYLLLIRPQARQAAQLREKINELKSGDKVVTKSGIYGTVMSVDTQKNRLTLKIDEANNTKIDVTLSSVDIVQDDKPKEVSS